LGDKKDITKDTHAHYCSLASGFLELIWVR